MGIGGTFANAIRKALNSVVPKKLWPKIKKRLRFAFNQRGEASSASRKALYHLTSWLLRLTLIFVQILHKTNIKFLLRNPVLGIRLPVVCGVEFEKPSLSYIDHAIVIDTDFRLFL